MVLPVPINGGPNSARAGAFIAFTRSCLAMATSALMVFAAATTSTRMACPASTTSALMARAAAAASGPTIFAAVATSPPRTSRALATSVAIYVSAPEPTLRTSAA